jgi:hypothetical protein
MEATICDYLAGINEAHVHGTPETHSFEVTIAPRRHSLYVASIILTETRKDGRAIIVEPIDSARPGGGARRLQGFRQAHFADYFLVVVARRALHPHLPEAAYDLLVPLEDFQPLYTFLKSV